MSKFTDAVERGLEGLEYESIGVCSKCETCQHEYGITDADGEENIDLDNVCDEGSFSWQPCDVCGSGLGGNRYAAHALDADRSIVHLDVCEDCMLYIANGDEPEEW